MLVLKQYRGHLQPGCLGSKRTPSGETPYRRKKKFCNAYGALQGAIGYKYNVFCMLNSAYGALQGAVSVAEFLLPTVAAKM